MPNKWVEFVRKWAKKHHQTYMCAASKQKCRDSYHAKYTKKGRKDHRGITRKNKTRMQRELLEKFKPYSEHRRRKGVPVE
jgi:hypothetical protein